MDSTKGKLRTCVCGCILVKGWKENFCSLECFVGDDPND